MKNIVKLSLAVAFICALAGAAMGYVYNMTKAPIIQKENAGKTAKMKYVLPADTQKTVWLNTDTNDIEFYRAENADGVTIGYAAIASSMNGFGGQVRIIAGLKPDGKIIGIIVDKQNETPGIGSRVVMRKQIISFWDFICGKAKYNPFPENEYLDQYNNKSLPPDGFTGGIDIQFVSGATFSSQAVLDAINAIAMFWHKDSVR